MTLKQDIEKEIEEFEHLPLSDKKICVNTGGEKLSQKDIIKDFLKQSLETISHKTAKALEVETYPYILDKDGSVDFENCNDENCFRAGQVEIAQKFKENKDKYLK